MCGREEIENTYIIRGECEHDDDLRIILCRDCMDKFLENLAYASRKMVKLNDIIWELVQCDDSQWRIFPMMVKNVNPYGQTRRTKSGGFETWNIYAEGEQTYMYASFYDEGRKWFFTKEEAKESLRRKKQKTET